MVPGCHIFHADFGAISRSDLGPGHKNMATVTCYIEMAQGTSVVDGEDDYKPIW
jgi:hypothetical protein